MRADPRRRASQALGFSRERAQKALIATGDTEAAVTLLSGLGPADDATLDMLANMALGRARGEREYKLVLVVNQELKMGVGKVAAQCSHATLGAYQSLQESGGHDVLERWLASGQPKVVLKAPSLQAMLELQARAAAARLPCFLVRDAGRTQVAAGSATVLAVGPAETAALDGVTGHLKLL
jgi:PTH2 family peptidyl-tRNA hydrolase